MYTIKSYFVFLVAYELLIKHETKAINVCMQVNKGTLGIGEY